MKEKTKLFTRISADWKVKGENLTRISENWKVKGEICEKDIKYCWIPLCDPGVCYTHAYIHIVKKTVDWIGIGEEGGVGPGILVCKLVNILGIGKCSLFMEELIDTKFFYLYMYVYRYLTFAYLTILHV